MILIMDKVIELIKQLGLKVKLVASLVRSEFLISKGIETDADAQQIRHGLKLNARAILHFLAKIIISNNAKLETKKTPTKLQNARDTTISNNEA